MAKAIAAPKERSSKGHKRHGKRAPQYFDDGAIIKEIYQIERQIGGGGFGQIFRVTDLRKKVPLAIKMEEDDFEAGRMILEQKILTKLRGKAHIPLIHASGHYAGFNFIVMQILGKNLSELRKRQPFHRLSVGTVVRVGQQCVLALKTLHDAGYIHRDVKPSNFCIGVQSQSRKIFLIDFGLARLYRNENGAIRRERSYAGFRGTMRYVSVTVHERRDQGPVDDFWSLFYSIIELIEGVLPWTSMLEPDNVALIKKNIRFEEFGMKVPTHLEDFSLCLYQLSYDQIPNYTELLAVLKKCQPKDITDETPFDWEEFPEKFFDVS